MDFPLLQGPNVYKALCSCLFLANLKNNGAISLHSNISGCVRVSHAQLVQGVFEVALDFQIFIK